VTCLLCAGSGLICENHPTLAWESGCGCGAGSPCACRTREQGTAGVAVSAAEAARTIPGITYRQIIYWSQAHYLHPVGGTGRPGTDLRFDRTEVAVATLMVRLIHSGLTVAAAARTARDLQSRPADLAGYRFTRIGPGVHIAVAADDTTAAPDDVLPDRHTAQVAAP
jgi:hypothetical protein